MSTAERSERPADVRAAVREHYGQHAAAFQPQTGCGCSSSACCGPAPEKEQAAVLPQIYEPALVADLPAEVTGLSMGCGDPVSLAMLQPGQTVLDLGSGGGIDCFLAARAVGEAGRVIGVDMTPQMLDAARANKARVGLQNVEFRLGEIEHLPVADGEVDVILSNCVINLSPDKPGVLREAFRALKDGGRLAVSDIVTDGPLPEAVARSLSAWAGCIAGALDMRDYRAALEAAGFVDVQITPVYPDREQVEAVLRQAGLGDVLKEGGPKAILNDGSGFQVIPLEGPSGNGGERLRTPVFSARITALKPGGKK